MTLHRILITAKYLNAYFCSVLFVYVLQLLKALFYANFRKLCWKVEYSGLFCATLYKYIAPVDIISLKEGPFWALVSTLESERSQ